MNMTTVPSDNLKAMQQEIADLKEQNASLSLLVSRYSKGMKDNLAECLKGQETIAQQAEAIRVAAEQIRRCDYTPARSTLLNASSPEILQARDEKVAEACCEVVDAVIDTFGIHSLVGVVKAKISSGEWRKYL